MALDLTTRYPGQIDNTDPTGYPFGKPKNKSTALSKDGTPLEKDLVSDTVGFQQALLKAAGLTPSGTPDKVGASQYLEALTRLFPSAVDNWPTRVSVTLNGAAANMTQGKLVQSVRGSSRLLVRTGYGVGGASGPFYYSTHTPELDAAGDWTLSAAPGIADWVACGIESEDLIVTCRVDGLNFARYTENLGGTWANGGGVIAGPVLDGSIYAIHYCPVSNRFIAVGGAGFRTHSHEASAAALAAATTWFGASASPGGETETMIPRAVESSASETLIAWSGGRVTRTTDGGMNWTVSAVLTGFSGAIAGMAYNASQGLWCVLGTTGQTWFSSNGSAWTAGISIPATFAVGSRVVALGRYWAACRAGSVKNHVWRWDTLGSADTYSTVRVGGTTGAIDMHAHEDHRLVAYRPGQFLYSLRLP